MQKVVGAEKSDIFDVLSYVAFAAPPVTREARAALAKTATRDDLTSDQREFIAFVLQHYVEEGVDQLDVEKLAPLLHLHFGSIVDANARLGPAESIRELFIGFQPSLYRGRRAA